MSPSLTACFYIGVGSSVGLGHLRRSMVIATELTKRGFQCALSVSDIEAVRRSDVTCYPTEVWPHEPGQLRPACVLVADTYTVDLEMCRAWKSAFPVRVVLDDLGDRELEAEAIVNPNIYGDRVDYSASHVGRIVGGPRYLLPSPEAIAIRTERAANPSRVLVAFGGTDDGTLGAPLARAIIDRVPGIGIDLVCSPLRPVSPKAIAAAAADTAITLHHGANMMQLMRVAALYVGAAGSTVWEASTAGLGVVVCTLFPNQDLIAVTLREYGIVALSGYDTQLLATAAENWLKARPHNPLTPLLDGRGGERVADLITEMASAASSTEGAGNEH